MRKTIEYWRNLAREAGVKGYSRLRKQDLIEAVEHARKTAVIYKGDLAVTRKLGAAYLRTCKVAEWRIRGSRSRPHWEPRAWVVPREVLDRHGLVPLSPEEVAARNEEQSRKARQAYDDRLSAVAERVGALPSGRLARAIASGRCDLDDDAAQLVAYKARYRHEHTDYDALLRAGHDRDGARDFAGEDDIPGTWDRYLSTYGFDSPEARALAATLQDPSRCHPTWFKEAEIAVRRAGLDLGTLTYDRIRDAIRDWRASREQDW